MGYKEYFVYILTNGRKTVLYTGMTNSLERRIWQHKNKVFPGFTKKYNCDRLIYFETYTEVTQAIAREKQIKPWARAKKVKLIERMNPEWKDLAAGWYDAPRETDPDPSTSLGMTPEGRTAAKQAIPPEEDTP